MMTTGYLSLLSYSWAQYTVVMLSVRYCSTHASLDLPEGKPHAYVTTAQHGVGTGSGPGFMNPKTGTYPFQPMHYLDMPIHENTERLDREVDTADEGALPSMQLYTPIPAFFSLGSGANVSIYMESMKALYNTLQSHKHFLAKRSVSTTKENGDHRHRPETERGIPDHNMASTPVPDVQIHIMEQPDDGHHSHDFPSTTQPTSKSFLSPSRSSNSLVMNHPQSSLFVGYKRTASDGDTNHIQNRFHLRGFKSSGKHSFGSHVINFYDLFLKYHTLAMWAVSWLLLCTIVKMIMPHQQQVPGAPRPRHNDHRMPPSWVPENERSYSFRAYLTDITHWLIASEAQPHQQASMIIQQLTGAARELARTIEGHEIMYGGEID